MGLFVAGLAFFISGCGAGQHLVRNPLPNQIPPRVLLASSVPFHAQKAFQCGPAAMAMVLGWSGDGVSADSLKSMVYVPDKKGSLQNGLVTAARRNGRLAYSIKGQDCLIKELAAGHPVIVLQNLGLGWFPKWHYAVAVGYDLNRQHIILHTGVHEQRTVGFRTFLSTWKRAGNWGLLVLPENRMPACARQTGYLKAVLGMQRAGFVDQAITAYRNASQTWPDSINVYMALGNALYVNGDLNGAAKSFRSAVEKDARNADALNNLAHILAELGRLNEAEAMALRAVQADTGKTTLYQQTLEQIRQRKMN
ncbi:MAG: PA2778 family cysteine peptidase [Desulfobacteraceae bacterium]|nr:PA2778 family cysteine peptidase [Desulfobacteraceae bacterium]